MAEEITTTHEFAELFAALAKAQGEIENATKDKNNPHFKSRYADLASVWDAARGPLSRNGIAIVQMPRPAEAGYVALETIIGHSSGQWMSSKLVMKLQKDDPQAVGSALTYARRYALAAFVGIAPDDDDGNAACGRGGKPAAKPKLTDDMLHRINIAADTSTLARAEKWANDSLSGADASKAKKAIEARRKELTETDE